METVSYTKTNDHSWRTDHENSNHVSGVDIAFNKIEIWTGNNPGGGGTVMVLEEFVTDESLHKTIRSLFDEKVLEDVLQTVKMFLDDPKNIPSLYTQIEKHIQEAKKILSLNEDPSLQNLISNADMNAERDVKKVREWNFTFTDGTRVHNEWRADGNTSMKLNRVVFTSPDGKTSEPFTGKRLFAVYMLLIDDSLYQLHGAMDIKKYDTTGQLLEESFNPDPENPKYNNIHMYGLSLVRLTNAYACGNRLIVELETDKRYHSLITEMIGKQILIEYDTRNLTPISFCKI